MQIKSVVNTVFSSNTFVLTEEESNWCWLIDIGDIEPVLDLIGTKELRGIFLTHTHYDHIYGINRILEYYPDCVVFTSEKGKEGLYSDKLNFSRYHGYPLIFKGKEIHVITEGEQFNLFSDIVLTAITTPGHDWSCVSYFTNQEIFTGDSYIPDVKLITSFPHSNKDDAKVSLDKILKLSKSRNIYPGHNEIVFLKEIII